MTRDAPAPDAAAQDTAAQDTAAPDTAADGAHFHLFAYGTLADGHHRLLAGCESVGRATVHGSLYDLGEFPALILYGGDAVPGRIWRCPAERLLELDRYEGVDRGLFRRVALRVEGVPCWLYVAGPRSGPRLTPDARIKPPREPA